MDKLAKILGIVFGATLLGILMKKKTGKPTAKKV